MKKLLRFRDSLLSLWVWKQTTSPR